MSKPDYLKSGPPARLFPVLATTSKEGRTTSIVLACMVLIKEFGHEMLSSIGVRTGKRSKIRAFTEVVFKDERASDDRPDGLIVLETGKNEWKALIETKVGNNSLSAPQIEKYRALAKEHSIDCVITISNQFTSSPQFHPLASDLNKRLKIPVFHWSWFYIVTVVELLFSNESVDDEERMFLLNELRRFLTHESAGIQGFTRMPPEWSEVVKTASTGGKIIKTSKEAEIVVDAWHQETRDLSLRLTRKLDIVVREKLPRRLSEDPIERRKHALGTLCDQCALDAVFDIPNAASPLSVTVYLSNRSITAGMTVKAPEDRKSSKARLNWLLKQIKVDLSEDHLIRFIWPGRSETTQVSIADALANPSIVDKDREHLQVSSFEIVTVRKLGGRFGQLANFVSDLEDIVPAFYEAVGQHLSPWSKPAPKVKDEPVEVPEIAEEADLTAVKDV